MLSCRQWRNQLPKLYLWVIACYQVEVAHFLRLSIYILCFYQAQQLNFSIRTYHCLQWLEQFACWLKTDTIYYLISHRKRERGSCKRFFLDRFHKNVFVQLDHCIFSTSCIHRTSAIPIASDANIIKCSYSICLFSLNSISFSLASTLFDCTHLYFILK